MYLCNPKFWQVFFLCFLKHTIYIISRMKGLVHSYQISSPLVDFFWVPPLFILRIATSILQWGQLRYLSLWWDSRGSIWFRVAFSIYWDTILLYFSSPFVWWCQLSIFTSTRNLPFFQVLNSFPDFLVLFLSLLLFFLFLYDHCIFFYAKFHSTIMAVYSYCLHQGFQFFSFFAKYLYQYT